MTNFEFVMPAMGEGIIEVTVTRWFVNEGDQVEEDDSLLEVATDKVDSEVPAPVSGRITKIMYRENDVAQIGDVLAVIESDIIETTQMGNNTGDYQPVDFKNNSIQYKEPSVVPDRNTGGMPDNHHILTPLVRMLAKERGLTIAELEGIAGSGQDGRVTKADINNYIKAGKQGRKSKNLHQETILTDTNTGFKELQPADGEEIIEMDRMRQIIADRMVQSKRVSAHVTSAVEVDITELVNWREHNKDTFLADHSTKLTYTPLIVDAVVKALKDFPGMNISVVDTKIVKKSDINIGVATALPDNNLIVPVIKNADRYTIRSIALKLDDLIKRARNGALEPNEVKGGTFTITNIGQFNNVSGTPIINQPEVAILAVGSILKKPGVVYVNNQATIGIRDIVILSLTYDHRVIDGALGGSFLNTIGRYLSKNIPKT